MVRDNKSITLHEIECSKRKGTAMAAMKPRTGNGPMECPKEGRGYVLRVPLEGGGRLVVELNAQEVKDLGAVLQETIVSMPKK
ncbi:unannotated protein [freshwater metagenome]|uniref:Unannotated protein n=1 Tax=freshwater metagenome TaxID=449393 RepID=A0A6J5YWN7_9ZZZZ